MATFDSRDALPRRWLLHFKIWPVAVILITGDVHEKVIFHSTTIHKQKFNFPLKYHIDRLFQRLNVSKTFSWRLFAFILLQWNIDIILFEVNVVSCYSERKFCCPESIPVILNVHVICIIVDITFNIDKPLWISIWDWKRRSNFWCIWKDRFVMELTWIYFNAHLKNLDIHLNAGYFQLWRTCFC